MIVFGDGAAVPNECNDGFCMDGTIVLEPSDGWKIPSQAEGIEVKAGQSVTAIYLVERFPLGQVLWAIETLPAFAATIRPIGQEKHDPKFQEASAFGSVHVVASTLRAISIFRVNEEPKFAFH
jgi:hypothetical protein